MFEDVRHERSLILLVSLTDPDILKQTKFTDHEIETMKNFGFRKITQTTNFKRGSSYCFTRSRIRIKHIKILP